MAFSKNTLNGLQLTKENFKNPPLEMGILPFWFWNGEMTEEEMEWQLKEYKDKGIPGLFIHGRFGESIGYLSEKWFERVKFAVEKGKEIGLDIWVYDEMNWPSGTAERQVPTKFPHLSQKYLEVVALNVDGPLFTFLEATDSRYVNTGDSKPIAAFACTEKEYQTGIKNLIDLTPNLSFNKVIPWEAPEGKWRLLYFLEKEVPYYIDTLNPESTNQFINLTHEKYKAAVGDQFGSIVPGFYTDEPAMHYYHVGVDNYVIPWTSQMFKIFREKRGYDLKPWLPALYFNMGEDTARIRFDFWSTLTEQYAETYYKRLHDWCEENNLIFTGHVLFEEWLRLQARCEGNIFKYLKQMHLIGVDHLYPKIGTRKEPDQHVALKLGSSAAHHFGSTRLLCESMGGTYWDCTLERMKWIANWEYVLGVNLFNNHGYHYSIEGERKRDWPPSQFYHHTWWKYYNYFTDYMARLGHILSGGSHVAKVLILWPINSMWTNYVPQKRNKFTKIIESSFNQLSDTLLRLHYDYDYVDEDVLAEATIKNGKLRIADEEYSLVILSPLTHIKRKSFDKIKKFVSSGGKVIADTILPFEFLETKKNGAVSEMTELFGINPEDLLQHFEKNIRFTKKSKGNENVYFINGNGISKQQKEIEYKKALTKLLEPDVTIDNDEVFYLHRIKDGYDVYFIVNTSQNDIGKVEISFEKTGKPEIWDPVTGESIPLNIYRLQNNRLYIDLEFASSQSYLVLLKGKLPADFITESNLKIEKFDGKTIEGYSDGDVKEVYVKTNNKKLKLPSVKSLPAYTFKENFNFSTEDDNVLLLSDWKLKIDSGENEGFEKESYEITNWLSVTNGSWEMQLPVERDHEEYPVDLLYRTSFEVEEIPSRLVLLIDGFSGSSYTLFINGIEMPRDYKRSRLDAEIKELDIRGYVKTGRNVVAVKLTVNRRTDGILDLLKLAGNFALAEQNNSYKIISMPTVMKPGDWTKSGLPFFSGTGIYKTQINFSEQFCSGKLFLEAECGEDVLEVIVNGVSKILPWHPYKVDITGLIQPGTNDLEFRVTNTLINMLEGVKLKSGLLKKPKISFFNKYNLNLK